MFESGVTVERLHCYKRSADLIYSGNFRYFISLATCTLNFQKTLDVQSLQLPVCKHIS